MSEASIAARKAMKEKIARITTPDPSAVVDASGYRTPDFLMTEAKTGMRPISRRQYKAGGSVKVAGAAPAKNAGRKPRATGGAAYENRNLKDLNQERAGEKHVGGFSMGGSTKRKPSVKLYSQTSSNGRTDTPGPYPDQQEAGLKRGGRATKADGGSFVPLNRFNMSGGQSELSKAAGLKRGGKATEVTETTGVRPTGGREARAAGGRAKGKTNINIIIGHGGQPQGGAQSSMDSNPHGMPPAGVTPPVPAPPQMPPQHQPLPQAAPPPMAAPPAGAPPMQMPQGPMAMDSDPRGMAPASAPAMRKSGGRTTHTIDNASGGGLGRQQKARLY